MLNTKDGTANSLEMPPLIFPIRSRRKIETQAKYRQTHHQAEECEAILGRDKSTLFLL